MRKNKLGLNVIWGVTYVVIVVAVLAIITMSVSTYLGKYFLSLRQEEQAKRMENCAQNAAKYTGDPDSIYSILSSLGIEANGRVLFIDSAGTVQADSFCLLNGTRPQSDEITAVLSGKQDFAAGYHRVRLAESAVTRDNAYLSDNPGVCWTAYYAHAIINTGSQEGILLLVSPVQDIVDRVTQVLRGLMIFNVIFIVIVAVITFYMSNMFTLSIRKFNRAIAKMSGGDFSVRVNEKEIAEFGELAKAFNSMSERLENLDASRNQFVSDASHELKTPLASMKILSESLLSQPDAPAELYREFLGDINSEIDRLSLVINDLLTLVKTDKGIETLIIGDVELGELIRRITSTVAPLAQKKHITVAYQYRDVTVRADELRMQQLFTNLIDNAIKYSPENTTITVDLSKTMDNAVVSVSDEGIGIAKEHLPHLFERFYRVDKARSRQAGGTGLGLSIVKQIVDQHGGTIEVESTEGKGTKFTVTSPLNTQERSKVKEENQ